MALFFFKPTTTNPQGVLYIAFEMQPDQGELFAKGGRGFSGSAAKVRERESSKVRRRMNEKQQTNSKSNCHCEGEEACLTPHQQSKMEGKAKQEPEKRFIRRERELIVQYVTLWVLWEILFAPERN